MDDKKITKPKIYIVCSILWFLLWTPITVWCFCQMIADSYFIIFPAILIFALQSVFAILFFLYAKNWCVQISDKEIVITNWRKKTTRYSIDELEVTYRRVLDDTFILWIGGKKITRIRSFDTNCVLITRLKWKK